ncbi:MAG: type II secretion system protein, partial [Planctomycetota bacterium]
MKKRGMTLTELLVTIGVITLLLLVLLPILRRAKYYRIRAACANNLAQIGEAFWEYANDYDDKFPVAGGADSTWGRTPNWQAADPSGAYGLTSEANGFASISANLYLLVRYEQIGPHRFVCPGDSHTTEFTLAKYDVRDKRLIDLRDFGPEPSRHVSYSYHSPYGPYALTSSNLPGMALAAERNPWIASPGYASRPATDFQAFDPNGARESIKRANAAQHQEDGQNVLFVDGHASFEEEPTCGIDGDNIYTSQKDTDIMKGALPTPTSQPANRGDSLLLHDPPRGG